MASGHGRAYFQLTAKQTTNLAATNSTTLRAFPIFLPDVSEQRMILTAIAAGTGAQDEALSRARREIALLLEYRTRLIADLVTGKVDVGEAAARLPEDVDNAAETLDEPNAELEGEESAEHVEAVAEEAGA
jgi:type I restriction enzyme S subunit